ncbi:hypothetical protein [Amycolatopsis eburnea]|uniref:Ricin B lectin domain-containing protein n=1 Tax=Amycolatopsis eburnea TaxID=2267691 RepID=A0A427SYY2_9PSEU|nr:hypothetical protein [Amycolatopsis eburnea]RSD10304.1 hypothetical protein EIY87_36080 [Amycolatopsis eburnea]
MEISTKVRRSEGSRTSNPSRRAKAAGVVATAAAALLTGAPLASAAPALAPRNFEVILRHSSGTIVGHITGNLTWSTSGRTVTFSNQTLAVKTGECVDVAYAGYQGNTRVTQIWQLTDRCTSTPIADFPLPTDVPGGILQVNISLTDVDHKNRESVACPKDQSVCHS